MPSDVSMSVSPAERTPTPGRTPNGAPLKFIRRKKPPADPLVRRKDSTRKLTAEQAPRTNGSSFSGPNGPGPNVPHGPATGLPQQNLSNPHFSPLPPPSIRPENSLKASTNNLASGFTAPAIAPFKDYPVILTKKDLMQGFRHHVARFAAKKPLDPRNQDEFVRPVRLLRKDGRAMLRKDIETKAENGEGTKDELLKAQQKAEREAKRDAENAKVAPTAGITRRGPNFKKTERVYRTEQSEEQRAQAKLHYEETVPWHLEDFENKQHWEGYYERALSGTHFSLVLSRDSQNNECFRMVPVEKWYKFSEKAKFGILDTEEAEALMKKKVKEPRWFMDSQAAQEKRDMEQHQRKLVQPFVGKWERGGGGSGVAKPVVKHESADADDLDFEEDRFADDEENANLFEEDEETKEAEERIKRDQLQANVFDLKEEKEYDKQEELEKKEKEQERKFGKKVKKVLRRREKRNDFASDSEHDPYTSGSSSASDTVSTDTERRKAEEREKEREDKDTPKSTPDKADVRKHKSSKPSSGRATPSGRPSKHGNSQPISRVSSSSNLKRPGSPLASDASGNESTRSRKKVKKNKSSANLAASSSQPTLQPPSRPSSPPNSSAPVQGTKKRRAGSGSDTEAGGGVSGGEMSDGTQARKIKKLKLKVGSPDGSRRGSRAGSPDPAAAGVTGAATPPSPPPQSDLPLPTGAEIKAVIPPEGISIAALIKLFPGRVVGRERSVQLQAVLKTISRFDKARKVLLPMES